jgi:class 3 adenylate cyclase
LDNADNLYQLLSQFDFTTLLSNVPKTPQHQTLPLTEKSQSLEHTLITTRGLINLGVVEKKQVTVMCIRIGQAQHAVPCEIRIDNEDNEVFHHLFQQHKNQCISIAQRYGAAKISVMGDTLICYFGYPNVADDNCRLSAKTALEMVRLMPQHGTDTKPSIYKSALHIGIHSGIVLIEHESINEGESINTAMALARQAKENQILCSDTTQQILKCHYDCEVYISDNIHVEELSFKTYLLKGERRSETSRIIRQKNQLSSFCLRQSTFKQLKNLLASETTSQTVNICGEAGIGKSWLVANLYLYCCTQTTSALCSFIPLMVRCRSEEKHSCLQPIIGLLNHRYKLNELTLNQRVQRLSELLAGYGIQSQDTLSLLCTWLGYTPQANPQARQILSPKTVKKHIFDALVFLLCKPVSLNQQCKLIFFVEDIHCSDPISLDFINHLVSSTTFIQGGYCLYSTSRTPLGKNWGEIDSRQIALKKLGQKQSQMFLSHLFTPHAINHEVEDVICDLADGNPLYIQELAKALQHNNKIHLIDGQIRFTSSNRKIDIPCSLRDQLQQKLDGLTKSKNVAQIASIIGNEFDLNMLLQSTGQNKAQLQQVLNELVQSDLICCRKNTGQEHFYFKHKLVRETIYASIPKQYKQKAQQSIQQ